MFVRALPLMAVLLVPQAVLAQTAPANPQPDSATVRARQINHAEFMLGWLGVLVDSVVPAPFSGIIGHGLDLAQGLITSESDNSAVEQQMQKIEALLKDSLELSQSLQVSLDDLAKTLLTTALNNTIEERLVIVNKINTLYSKMYLPQGDGKPAFPRKESEFLDYARLVAAKPGTYRTLINDLGGFVPAKAGEPLRVSQFDLNELSENLTSNLAPNNAPIAQWKGLQDKYVNLLNVNDSYGRNDPALAVTAANSRVTAMELAYANSVSELYHLWSLKLALYFTQRSLFIENGIDKLRPPFPVVWENGYNEARRQAYAYYMGVMHNQLVAVFGGRKAWTSLSGVVMDNSGLIVYEPNRIPGVVKPYTTSETVTLINGRVTDGGASSFIDPNFPTRCALTSVSMEKSPGQYRLGNVTGYCPASNGKQRINLAVPYRANSTGLNYETLAVKGITVRDGKLAASAQSNNKFLSTGDYAQNGSNDYGLHWPMATRWRDTGWDITCGLFSGGRYDFQFIFEQGTIQINPGMSSLGDKKDWGERETSLDQNHGYTRSSAGNKSFRFPTGKLDGRNITYGRLDAKYWACMNRTYPHKLTIQSSPPTYETVHYSAYIYGRKGEAYFATTSSGRIFTINYVNPDNMWFRNQVDGDRYYGSSNPNYSRPPGGWISTISLQCMKGDDTCKSDFISGNPVLYWQGGNHMEMVQLRTRSGRDLEVVYSSVLGSYQRPPL